MKIIELILDEEQDEIGVDAISIVESPAIESDFVALKNEEIKLAEVDKDKRILMGALLIPNKPILLMIKYYCSLQIFSSTLKNLKLY